MKTILVPLAQFLDTYLGSFARNVLTSLGFGVISFAGIKLVFDELVSLAQAQFVSMASDALSIVQLAGVGEAIGITVGAITYRLTITTMSQIGILPS